MSERTGDLSSTQLASCHAKQNRLYTGSDRLLIAAMQFDDLCTTPGEVYSASINPFYSTRSASVLNSRRLSSLAMLRSVLQQATAA